jgi:hypothetical protein
MKNRFGGFWLAEVRDFLDALVKIRRKAFKPIHKAGEKLLINHIGIIL